MSWCKCCAPRSSSPVISLLTWSLLLCVKVKGNHCLLFLLNRSRHFLAVDLCSFSERDAFWWKLGASTVKVHWHAWNRANQKIWLQCQVYVPGMWGTGSGLCCQKCWLLLEKHALTQSFVSIHEKLGVNCKNSL